MGAFSLNGFCAYITKITPFDIFYETCFNFVALSRLFPNNLIRTDIPQSIIISYTDITYVLMLQDFGQFSNFISKL